MPESARPHADLGDLNDAEAAHLGVLCSRLERAAIAVHDVPRIQVLRWGDGGEHLHWWLLARPTGMLQLRGTFLSSWDDILPARDPAAVLADLRLVAEQLRLRLSGLCPLLHARRMHTMAR